MFKKAVQRGRSERRCEVYSVPYVEPLSDARTKLADFFYSLLENFGEDEVSDTSEESRRWYRHHPSQDHVANRRPAHAVPAFEKADSDNG